MPQPDPVVQFKQVVCKVIKDKATVYLAALGINQEPSVKAMLDMASDRIIAELEIRALAVDHITQEDEVEFKWPDGWWQAFKAAAFDRRGFRWILKRWPIRYHRERVIKRYVVQKVCHHLYYNHMDRQHTLFLTQPDYPNAEGRQ